MMSSAKFVEPTHLKIITRFDILLELITYVQNVIAEFTKNTVNSTLPSYNITEIFTKARNLRDYYYNKATPMLIYHNNINSIIQQYYQFITSENIIDKIERIYTEITQVNEILKQNKSFNAFVTQSGVNTFQLLARENCGMFDDNIFSRHLANNVLIHMTYAETIARFLSLYSDNKLQLPPTEYHENDKCPQCNIIMTLFPEESEMRCNACGYIEILYGTLFEDSQCYNQQIICVKHKKHNPNNHCIKWLHQIQAKESKVIPQQIIDIINARAVREYTRGNVLRSMSDVKCRRVRVWLRDTRLAKLNNHAPLIRKIVTGLNGPAVSPSQLVVEEEQKLLVLFSMIIEIFEVLSKREDVLRLFNKIVIRNKLYYPFFLLKLLLYFLRGDARLPGLIECIHLQSSATLTKDDMLWRMICEEMTRRGKKIVYEPTDRTILIDIY
jgi:hypothetical protein